jgi:hypothetical protein
MYTGMEERTQKVSTLWMVGKVVQAYCRLTRVVSLVRTPTPSRTEATRVCGLELLVCGALSY